MVQSECDDSGLKRKAEETEGPASKKQRVEGRPDHWKKFELINNSFEEYYKVIPF